MHPLRAGRRAWAVLCLWAGMTAWAGADPGPTPTPSTEPPPLAGPRDVGSAAAVAPAEPDSVVANALELERKRQWGPAIEAYEEALSHAPGRADLRHRLRLCEAHYRLGRRYQDQSFRNVLLRLSREQALELYDELLERIASHYVEAVAFEPLLRRGLDNLEVALRDPAFLRTNAKDAAPEAVAGLRKTFKSYRERIVATSRPEADAFVARMSDLGRQAAGLPPAAVVLEFAYGSCDALDDYTSYLSPDKLDDLYSTIQGNFVGLGVELKADPDGLRLINVLKGGPAWDAHLKPGDRITHVDGRAIRGVGLDEAAGRLQGVEGSVVAITVQRGVGKAHDLRLVRRPVEVQSVAEAKIVEPSYGVGYVQLTGFQKSSAAELANAVSTLQGQGMRYLILDLRGNPGGLLDVAVEIADRFLDQGVIVTTRGRAPGQTSVYRARPDGAWRMPVAVLIDHDSASASEILAGALKDHGRAIVIGERSYGKGSVQSIFPLRAAPAGLKLTTAKFYSPRNRSYSEQGVEPDRLVRTAAKPADPDEPPTAVFGDPSRDPVLESAIREATPRGAAGG